MSNVYGGGQHPAGRNRRRGSSSDHEEEEGSIKCSGKCCQSCTAGVIADCVAVCCCPCAVVNIMILAFFRLPWTLGKRIFKIDNNSSKTKNKRKCGKGLYLIEAVEQEGVSRKGKVEDEEGIPDLVMSSSSTLAEMRDELLNNNGDLNEEDAWIELNHYLGFGRVSSHHSPHQEEEDLHRRLG